MSRNFFPTTFQQSITFTSKNVCNNTLPIIYKCNTHANASTILKNKLKEHLPPQLISIYFMISLIKMSRKIIKDIPWIITLTLPHISSIQHVCPSNQWYQKQKINQTVEWEKETINIGFQCGKPPKRSKTTSLPPIEKLHYEK